MPVTEVYTVDRLYKHEDNGDEYTYILKDSKARSDLKNLVDLIDNGPKNKLKKNSGTTPSGVGYFLDHEPVSLPAGRYVLYCERTGNTSTSIAVFSGSTRVASVTRGAGVNVFSQDLDLTVDCDSISLYIGTSQTVNKLMLCSAAAYGLSDKYVPYCPTIMELYEMIQNQ